jgi:undecaprenyl diphosphate synthase
VIHRNSSSVESTDANVIVGESGLEISTPRHVAIIMDGNGRWATRQGKTRTEGHRAGTENVRRVIEAFVRSGVECLTLFAFSTENWGRPTDEVSALIEILQDAIAKEVDNLHAQGVRIQHLGSLDRLNTPLRHAIESSIKLTRENTRLTLCVAFNYGGRAEIMDAVKRIVADNVSVDDIDEKLFSEYLYTSSVPDPDLIIRTGGEMRLSNFLIWQAAYAEYYATDVCWPDFDSGEIEKALEAFRQRNRRFGRVDD